MDAGLGHIIVGEGRHRPSNHQEPECQVLLQPAALIRETKAQEGFCPVLGMKSALRPRCSGHEDSITLDTTVLKLV